MSEPLIYSLIVIGIIAVAIIVLAIIKHFINKDKINKMFISIERVLDNIVSQDKENNSYKRINNSGDSKKHDLSQTYEYVLETLNFRYYIKVVPNFDNQEICVNNSVKWQLRKSFNDESLRFVSDIDLLMRLDLPVIEDKKTNKKLYIIYPNARSLLKYINECEMEFVHPTTDVYGTNIITFVNLQEHMELINM